MGESPQVVLHQETLYRSRNPTRRWLHRQRRNLVNRMIERFATGGPALEVGPGAGGYLPALGNCSSSVTALDIEPAYLAHAAGMTLQCGSPIIVSEDICQTTLPAGGFDLILCSEVIEHMPDSAGALASMRRLLSPNGHLILTTPQRHSTVEWCASIATSPGFIAITRAIYGESVVELGHINLLTRGQLVRQIQDAGFDILWQDQLGAYLPVLAEFGGIRGHRLLERIEHRVKGTRWSSFLWTQAYALRPHSSSAPH